MVDYISLEEYGKKISLLFVEDDENISKEMLFLLKDIFIDVELAQDGADAFSKYQEYYNKNGKYFDLVITDILMPNMNGIELIRNLYEVNLKQKVVVLSAHNESHYLIELLNLGVAQFIIKPIDYNVFLETIYKISKEIYLKIYDKSSEKKSLFIKLADNLLWNKQTKQLFVENELCKLTKKEFLFIDLLLYIPEKTYTNEEIIDLLWKDDMGITSEISNLKNLISRLRKKIPQLNIENIYGFGYRLTISS